MSSAELSIAFGSAVAELEQARDRVREHLERAGVDETATYAVELVVEELGGNAIRYGHAQSIRMDVVLAPAVVRLSIVDDGRPFDPTRHPEPTRARSLAEASVGGRGISLVRRFVRTMRYERDAGHNRLEIEIARALPD